MIGAHFGLAARQMLESTPDGSITRESYVELVEHVIDHVLARAHQLGLRPDGFVAGNDPLFDLASAIGFHNLDERRQQVFLDAYAGGADSELRERLARQLRIYDAIQWLWLANRQLASPRSEQARRLEELQQRIR